VHGCGRPSSGPRPSARPAVPLKQSGLGVGGYLAAGTYLVGEGRPIKALRARGGLAYLVLLAIVVLAMGALSGSPAAASSLPPGAVRVVALPPVRLHTPRDGRVNGDGFTAQVTGYRFGRQFGPASSAVQAAPGRQLLTFGLVASTRALTATLEVDGHGERLQLPRSTPASVPVYYLASLPARAHRVALEVSKDGYTQEFSFTTGERVGPQPAVLYDSITSWQVSQSFTGEASLSVLGPQAGAKLSAHQVMLLSTTLTYFLPSTGATPGGPSEAWLVVEGTTFPFYTTASQGLPHLAYARALRASEITLALPDGKPVAAKLVPDGRAAKGELFDGYYYWRVPASTQAATLKITLPPLVATDPATGARLKFQAQSFPLPAPSPLWSVTGFCLVLGLGAGGRCPRCGRGRGHGPRRCRRAQARQGRASSRRSRTWRQRPARPGPSLQGGD
jgi:hypothetical protein